MVQFRAFVGRVDPEDAVHPEGAERTRRVVVVKDVRQVVAHGIVLADLRDLVGGSVSLEDGGVAGAEPFDPLTISLAEGDHDPPAVQERHQLFAAVGVSGRVGEREGDADGGGVHAYIVPRSRPDVKRWKKEIFLSWQG